MKTLKLREARGLFQGHTASKWWSQDSNAGLSFQEPSLYLFQSQFSSVYQTLCNPWTAARQSFILFHCLSFLVSRSLLIESVMPSNHLILCHPLLLLPSIFPSIWSFPGWLIGLFLRIRWSKYWSCSFNISPSNEHPGLISFKMDWLDLLAVQGTLESSPTLQFESISSSVLLLLLLSHFGRVGLCATP